MFQMKIINEVFFIEKHDICSFDEDIDKESDDDDSNTDDNYAAYWYPNKK